MFAPTKLVFIVITNCAGFPPFLNENDKSALNLGCSLSALTAKVLPVSDAFLEFEDLALTRHKKNPGQSTVTRGSLQVVASAL